MHITRSTRNPPLGHLDTDRSIKKLDFVNAFNTLRRDALARDIPRLYDFVSPALRSLMVSLGLMVKYW